MVNIGYNNILHILCFSFQFFLVLDCQPENMSAYFGANWTVIPAESGHTFRVKLDIHSG